MNFGNYRESRNFMVDPISYALSALYPSNDTWRQTVPGVNAPPDTALWNLVQQQQNRFTIPSMVRPGVDVSPIYQQAAPPPPIFGLPAPLRRDVDITRTMIGNGNRNGRAR